MVWQYSGALCSSTKGPIIKKILGLSTKVKALMHAYLNIMNKTSIFFIKFPFIFWSIYLFWLMIFPNASLIKALPLLMKNKINRLFTDFLPLICIQKLLYFLKMYDNITPLSYCCGSYSLRLMLWIRSFFIRSGSWTQ